MEFDPEWVRSTFKFDEKGDPITDENAILHFGNLNYIYTKGEEFYRTHKVTLLKEIQTRFKIDTLEKTKIFLDYMFYIMKYCNDIRQDRF